MGIVELNNADHPIEANHNDTNNVNSILWADAENLNGNDYIEELENQKKNEQITIHSSPKNQQLKIVTDNTEPNEKVLEGSNNNDHNELIISKEQSNTDEKNDDETTAYHSKKRFFPKGIVNPNYPGFQHLAYTLSEFFVEQQPYDSCDSDFSDQDNDFIAEYEENNDESEGNGLYKNYLSDSDSNSDKFEHTTCNKSAFIADINQNIKLLQNNKSLLKLSLDQKEYMSLTSSSELSKQDYINDCTFYEHNLTPNTPDILMKNCDNSEESRFLKKCRPDLLRGVSSLHLNNNEEAKTDVKLENIAKMKEFKENCNKHDDVQFVNTPVDIIGNFGQEVEHEFGLIVSGYRQFTKNDINHESSQRHQTQKMKDAFLSATCDTIVAKDYKIDESDLKKFANIDEQKATNGDAADNVEQLVCNSRTTNAQNVNVKVKSTNLVYNKLPYDDRQLPPIPLDYKCCQSRKRIRQNTRSLYWNETSDKQNNLRQTLHTKNGNNKNRPKSCDERICMENELFQYHQLINDKEHIVRSSKYAKLSSWAQYLTTTKHTSTWTINLKSSSTLELFDAYKIENKSDMDFDALQKHFRMASEIEKQKRSERDEIRRKLAINDESSGFVVSEKNNWRSNTDARRQNSVSSDNESYSSDSETCPKLSKVRQQRTLTNDAEKVSESETNKLREPLLNSQEDEECAFFTKQAKLQIETRMALSQAKQIAFLQMELNRQNQCNSPITGIVKSSLKIIGIENHHKRRLSRQLLTNFSIVQLQILLNNFHIHIEHLNDSLVNFLLKRDDLQLEQDALMNDIEKLSKYLGAIEKKTQGKDKSNRTRNYWNF